MRHLLTRLKLIAFFAIGFMLSNAMFQNCGAGFESASEVVSNNLPSNHPGDTDPNSPNPKEIINVLAGSALKVFDYRALSLKFHTIFGSSESENFEGLVNDEIVIIQDVFGGACDPVASGSVSSCYGVLSNMNTMPIVAPNSTREAGRIQLCQRFISNSDFLNNLLGQMANRSLTPNASSIPQLFEVFYPGETISQQILDALIGLEVSAAQNRESIIDRWRLQALAICESSGWQLL